MIQKSVEAFSLPVVWSHCSTIGAHWLQDAVRARTMPTLFHPYALPFDTANQPKNTKGKIWDMWIYKQASKNAFERHEN